MSTPRKVAKPHKNAPVVEEETTPKPHRFDSVDEALHYCMTKAYTFTLRSVHDPFIATVEIASTQNFGSWITTRKLEKPLFNGSDVLLYALEVAINEHEAQLHMRIAVQMEHENDRGTSQGSVTPGGPRGTWNHDPNQVIGQVIGQRVHLTVAEQLGFPRVSIKDRSNVVQPGDTIAINGANFIVSDQ